MLDSREENMVGPCMEFTQEDMNNYVKYFKPDLEFIYNQASDDNMCYFTCTSTYDPNDKWEIPYRCRWNWLTGLVID